MDEPLEACPLLQGRRQKRPLRLDSSQVLRRVARAETHDLHGLLAVQMLLTCGKTNAEALARVFIVHVDRDVKRNAAHRVDKLFKNGQIDQHVPVRPEADNFLDAQQKLLHACLAAGGPAVGRVDLRHGIFAVDERVARNGDKAHLARRAVHGEEHHRIRPILPLVGARDQNRRAPGLALAKPRLGLGLLGNKKVDAPKRDGKNQNQRQNSFQKPMAAPLF